MIRTAMPTAAATHWSLLDALEPEEREALVARLRPRRYKRGQAVFNDGDHGDCLYLVQSGRLDVQVTTMDGHTISLRVIQPGEFFGELALLKRVKRMGTVTALTRTSMMIIDALDFENLLDRDATLRERILRCWSDASA